MRLLDLTFSTAQAARIMKVANRPEADSGYGG